MRFLLVIISVLSFNLLMAQIPGGGAPAITGRISGTIIDSLTKKPVDYASIGLGRVTSTKSTNGAITDAKGVFKIDNVVPGSYKLTITFLGYQTKVVAPVTTTPGKPDLNLGKIILSPLATALGEVTVTGQTPIIENRVDKVVYNAEKDATVVGGNAGDVLRKVPMVSVDQDGNVALRGSQNVRVLINGKPSGAMAANVGDAMKMLPADQIKSVEVVTSPSAKYDAEGSAGIINIITKKSNMSGVSGSVSGGVGIRQNNGNANLNINKNRLSITGNFGGNLTWPQISRVSVDRSDADTWSSQRGESEVNRHSFSSSGNVSYDINSSNSISSGIRFNQGGFNTDGNSTLTRGGTALATIVNLNETENKNKFTGFDWSSDFTHKFKGQGHEISLAGQWTRMRSQTDFLNFLTAEPSKDQTGDNNGVNNEYTIQADYALPVNKVVKLELGSKAIIRRIESTSIFNSRAGNSFVLNPDLSNIYDYEQDVYSGYSVLTFQLKNGWGVQGGGRVETTLIRGDVDNINQGFTPFSRPYSNFVPSFSVSKAIKSNNLRLSYSKRIQRPSLQYLNPFRNISNRIFHSIGNPELSPEISHNVELNFSTFIKKSVINASLYFRHTDDLIESFVRSESYTDPDGTTQQVSVSRFQNIGQNNSIGSSLFTQISPVKGLTLRGNINAYTYQPKVSGTYTSGAPTSNKTFFMTNAYVGGSVQIVKGFLAETYAIINSPRRTSQGRNPAFNLWNLSLNKEILKKKGKIGVNVIDMFNERKNFSSRLVGANGLTQSSNFSVPFRSVGVSFSWQFGKMNFNAQQPRKKRGVNNDDLKQDGAPGGQGM